MKKILLVTIFRVPNYGSVLQAFASQYILEKTGASCSILNYDHNNSRWGNSHGVKKTSIKSKIGVFLGLKSHHRKQKQLNRFIRKYFHLTRKCHDICEIKQNLPQFDIYIIGSDQVWNTKFTNGDPVFLLDFVGDDKKCISLASSFATHNIATTYIESFVKGLAKFKKISVREENGIKILKNIGFDSCKLLLDPTLLLSCSQWNTLLCRKSKFRDKTYILIYMWCYAFEPRPYIFEVIRYFKEKMNCPIYVLEGYDDMKGSEISEIYDMTDSSIPQFLDLFSNASLVITSSFHGTAFALNFGIPLISIVPENGDDRQMSLLQKLNVQQCMLKVRENISDANPFYDKDSEQLALEELRVDSLNWIEETIK